MPNLAIFFKNSHRSRHMTQLFAKLCRVVWAAFLIFAMLLSLLWLTLVLWFHLPHLSSQMLSQTSSQIMSTPSVDSAKLVAIGRTAFLATVVGMVGYVLWAWQRQKRLAKKVLAAYGLVFATVLLWYWSLPPLSDRAWRAEVSQLVGYEQDADHPNDPNRIVVHNVRDFVWQRNPQLSDIPSITATSLEFYAPEKTLASPIQLVSGNMADSTANAGKLPDASELPVETIKHARWISRTVNLDDLVGIDIINSYWMGRPIAHTLISFRFAEAEPLAFSFEIRKEEGENFSALGGFVKKYELALVAATERDILYTRSNVRGEQVYIFPIAGLTKTQMQAMFRAYLQKAEALQHQPEWYNTLTANCTTLIFDMATQVAHRQGARGDSLPYDARILASGYVPSYLLDNTLLDNTLLDITQPQTADSDINRWMQRAHANPKIQGLTLKQVQTDGSAYSNQIRQELP